jgi:hypothetical protein
VHLVHHCNPELAVLELAWEGQKILDKDGEQPNAIVNVTHATWNPDEEAIFNVAKPPTQIEAEQGLIVLPESVWEDPSLDLHTIANKAAELLSPNAFACAIGPAAKLEDAFRKAKFHQHALIRAEDGSDSALLIVGPQKSWVAPFIGTDFVILEPADLSEAADAVARQLETQLEQLKYHPTRIKWPAASYGPLLKRSRCISLMEVKAPLITDLDAEGFQHLQQFFAAAADVLWVTAKDDPAMFAIDGMARSIRNEDAGTNIRTLHFSGVDRNTAEIILRAATCNTLDHEFTVEDGTVHSARITSDPDLSNRATGREVSVTEQVPLSKGGVARGLEIGELGQLDTLHLVERKDGSGELGDDEVLLKVAYSGLK